MIRLLKRHPFQFNSSGHLTIGDLDTTDLAETYATPLYVYDVSMIRENCRAFVETFKNLGVRAKVAYASKAFSSIAMIQVIEQEGLCLDVVSQGELHTALQANFPSNKIHMHGNNKSVEELTMAIQNEIGCIVIDNFYEIELLENILEKYDKTIDVLIRVTPGIKSKTHEYIMTGNEDSKFGFDMKNGQADQAFKQLYHHDRMRLQGLHCHLGSQLFGVEIFIEAAKFLLDQISIWKKDHDFIPNVLNLGGGFGIRYTKSDEPLPYQTYIHELVAMLKQEAKKIKIPLPEIWIEPGRAIAGNAGITLYTIGSKKHIPRIRKYISVDGGMSDNLRPALYDAKYEGVIANKANLPVTEKVSIAGKCCESGDMIIYDLPVPPIEYGDLLAVFSTGAYGYSMASHYNRIAKPAVVFVENGQSQLVVQRETYEDVVKNDLPYTKY